MPIRIKDIATTASASSALDFFAIDGNTNNTRKLSAFSPTFGGSVVVSQTLTVSGSGTTAIGGMVKGAAATYSGNPPAGVATAFQVDVENGSTRDLFTFGDTTRCGMLRGYHDGSHRVEWRFGRYFSGAFAEYLRITGVAATDAVLSVYGTSASTTTSSGALVVGNGTQGGLGVGGAINAGSSISSWSGIFVARAAAANPSFYAWTENTVSDRGVLGFEAGSSILKYRAGGYSMSTGTEVFSITNTGTVTASDYLLSGSSVSLRGAAADRGVRQELVFDGTRGVACSTPILNGDWSVAFVANRATSATQQYLIGNDALGCFYCGFRTNGSLFNGKAGFPANTDLTLGNVVGVTQHIVLVRSGSTITAYSNGTAVGTTTDAQTYSAAAATLFAADSAGSSALNGTGALIGFYNRALSATEVAALYANGTPSSFDYWAAGSGVNVADCGTLAVFNGATYSSSTSTSITGLNLPAINGQVQIGGGYATVKGQRIRVTFSVTGVTDPSQIWVRWVNSGPETWVPINTAGVTGSSGTYTYEHTTEVSGSNYIQFRNFGASAQNGINVTNWSAVTIGLRVAPDAAQPGGGLYWYDTSGSNLTLVLPATGVNWSVLTSGRSATTFRTAGALVANGNINPTSGSGTEIMHNGVNGYIFAYNRDALVSTPLYLQHSGGNLIIGNSSTVTTITGTTNSSAFNNGALVVSGGIGAAGAIFSQQNSNAIVNGLNAANTNTGNAATLRHTLTAGTNASTIEAYSNGHATFPGRLRFGTPNGQMDFVPSGVLSASIDANGVTVSPLHTPSRKLEVQIAHTINTENYLRIASNNGTNTFAGEFGYGLTAVGDPEVRINRVHAGTVSNVLKIRTTDGASTFAGSLTVIGDTSTFGVNTSTSNSVKIITGVGTIATPRYGLLDFRNYNDIKSGAYIRVANRESETNSFLMNVAVRSNADVLTSVATFSDSQLAVVAPTNSTDNISGALVVTGGVGIGGNVNMGGRLFINNTSAANGALSASAVVATFGADATLGGLSFNVKGFPSATAGSRYVQLTAADTLDFRELRINDQGGNVGIGGSSSTITVGGTLIANASTNAFRIPTAQTPASQTATGTTGQITWDSSYIYVCTATNNWGRSSLSWSGGGGGGGGSSNIWIPASEWIPRTTNGCGINSLESTTNRVNYDVLEFDPGIPEYAQATVVMPNNWNAGTVTAKFHWTAGSSSGDVVWQLSGRAYANDDAIDQATGTAQSSTDTLTAVNDLDISPATPAITIAGTAANGNPVVFELSRNATAGGDTLGTEARLIGVEISYTI